MCEAELESNFESGHVCKLEECDGAQSIKCIFAQEEGYMSIQINLIS